MRVASHWDDILVTYSLGSCMGLTLYDKEAGVGGMIHCMLPLSRMAPERAKAAPAMFVDTGFSLLLTRMFERGVQRRNLVARIAGAAQTLDPDGFFRIGERNRAVARRVLEKNGIHLQSEMTGGSVPRTMYLYMETGKTMVRSQGEMVEL
jgi:chemotaxis protein CheD